MLIMAKCVLWLIWMLRNINWTIGSFDLEFWFEQMTFKVEQLFHQTLLVSQNGLWFWWKHTTMTPFRGFWVKYYNTYNYTFNYNSYKTNVM
jgi:hypothetical protein